ncbi:tetratricopeptide repeat protein [Candidatus Micrarchaeota archaeon]|nr:tetratricopeptide repeat protein [Candidatus Micrarchaeota archaeon]MBD3418136.1 tetratricopeptide repeat protein [Candidatus Micrarchaeota archaeon]
MAYLKKLRHLAKENKYSELEQFCKSKLQFSPGDPDLMFYYAVALEEQGEYAKARNVFEKLYRITHDWLFRICEAIPEYMQGNSKTAKKILKKATEKENKSAANLFFAFRIAVNANDAEAAKEALWKAFAIDPEKTLGRLREFFEKTKEKRPERRKLFVALLGLLSDMRKEIGEG